MNYNFPVAFLDTPEVLDTAITPIPANNASPLQVIADSGVRSAVAVDYVDNTGELIGVYLGPVGFENLVCIIGSGETGRAWAVFAAHSRVSLRSMTSVAINSGTIAATLMGY